MRRIALYSDIHGNVPALEAVYADIDAAGIAERYCLGDLIGYGPDPVGVVERVRASGDTAIRGNYDEGVARRAGSCGCYYATDQARSDGDHSYRFTDSATDDGTAKWLLGQPAHVRLECDGARILLAHGSPRTINEYLLLDRTEKQLRRLATDAHADAVCHGHIHIPYHRSFLAREGEPGSGTLHYVSSGSVGKPKDGDARAGWVELMLGSEDEVRASAPGDDAVGPIGATDGWLAVAAHRVEYDIDAVARAMLDSGLPPTLADALREA